MANLLIFNITTSPFPSFFFFIYVFLNYYPRSIFTIFAPANSTLNPKLYFPHVKPHYIHSPFSKKMADLDHLYS